MAKIRYKGALAVDGPNGPVTNGDTVEVLDGDVYGFTCSANWEPVDKVADAAHAKAAKAIAADVKAEKEARGITGGTETVTDVPSDN